MLPLMIQNLEESGCWMLFANCKMGVDEMELKDFTFVSVIINFLLGHGILKIDDMLLFS